MTNIQEVVDQPKSEDEARFLSKHIIKVMGYKKQVEEPDEDESRPADYKDGEDMAVYEAAESKAQAIAARIALKHKREGTKPEKGTASAEMMKMSEKDLEDFTKTKPGAPDKVQKEEAESLEENFKAGTLELRDGSKVKLSSSDAMALNSLFVTLNDKNQAKMDSKLMANKKGFAEILSFAKEV
jgi:hypothetical protein